ncbi:carboxymuconolactone decarboxylase family protein [Nonomuraea sp. bgisy101]|uniref:carboxymuconolactone decarboxylase family protein n=1 Tax=Nonomuraea sp. bgisy101 TaxID=3413784 RepID=UPI003D74FCF7
MVVRHVRPVSPQRARGLVAEVYRQVEADFSSIGPAVTMTSPAPEILASGWALARESQLAGQAPALHKSLVALGVSQVNRCGYDSAAWLAVLRLTGSAHLAAAAEDGGLPADPELAAVLAWARATGAGRLQPAPFAAATAPEFLGTALFTHFTNRLVAAMLPAGLTPGSMDPGDEPPFDGAPVLRGLKGELEPGATASLLERCPTGPAPAWAGRTAIGPAYAALEATAAQGAGLLTEAAQAVVRQVIGAHRGRIQPHGAGLFDGGGLTDDERLGAKVAIMAGLAPSDLTDEDVAAWKATNAHHSDHCAVMLLSYGSMTAVSHIASDLADQGSEEASPRRKDAATGAATLPPPPPPSTTTAKATSPL